MQSQPSERHESGLTAQRFYEGRRFKKGGLCQRAYGFAMTVCDVHDNRRNRHHLLPEFLLYPAVLDPVSIINHYYLPIGVPPGSAVEGAGTCSAAFERQSCANVAAVRVAAAFVADTLVPLTRKALPGLVGGQPRTAMDILFLVLQPHVDHESLARAAGNQRQPPVGARSQLRHGISSVLSLC